MDHIERMFPFNLLDKRWFQSTIVSFAASNANGGGGDGGHKPKPKAPGLTRSNGSRAGEEEEDGSRSGLARTWSHVPTAEEMRKVFEQFDVNKDGEICSDELSSFMSKLGFSMTDDEVTALVKAVDEDSNGSVDFEEFYKLYSTLAGTDQAADDKAQEEEHEKHLRSAFGVFDKNNDGFISVEELQMVLKSLGMKEGHSYKKCQQMIQGVDADGNGKVDFQEFKTLMSSDAFH